MWQGATTGNIRSYQKNRKHVNIFEVVAVKFSVHRDGSRAAVTSKMERFVIIVNGWKPLTIITTRSIFGAAAVLDPPLVQVCACVKEN